MKPRYEQMLEAIANGEQITLEPHCRLEQFIKAYANNEGASNLPEPRCREEEFWTALIQSEAMDCKCQCKRETYLKAIANKEFLPEQPCFGREETLFRKILDGICGPVTNENYVENGVLYIREAYSATLADALTLR